MRLLVEHLEEACQEDLEDSLEPEEHQELETMSHKSKKNVSVLHIVVKLSAVLLTSCVSDPTGRLSFAHGPPATHRPPSHVRTQAKVAPSCSKHPPSTLLPVFENMFENMLKTSVFSMFSNILQNMFSNMFERSDVSSLMLRAKSDVINLDYSHAMQCQQLPWSAPHRASPNAQASRSTV